MLIWWLSAFFRLYKYCKGSQGKNGGGGEPASNYVAVSNHLFKGADACDVRRYAQKCSHKKRGEIERGK